MYSWTGDSSNPDDAPGDVPGDAPHFNSLLTDLTYFIAVNHTGNGRLQKCIRSVAYMGCERGR